MNINLSFLSALSHNWHINYNSSLPVRVIKTLTIAVKFFFSKYTIDITTVENQNLLKKESKSWFAFEIKKINDRLCKKTHPTKNLKNKKSEQTV